MPTELTLASAEDTAALGAALARGAAGRAGLVVYLDGPLGAGKTTLVRGALRALGVRGTVRSPTYTLLEPYDVDGRPVLHLDLYRLQRPEELLGLGLADYSPQQSWWWVEWPERAAALLPPADLHVTLAHAGDLRHVRLAGPALDAEFSARAGAPIGTAVGG